MGEHTRHAKAYTHRCANWIKKLEREGKKPVIELLEECSIEDLGIREVHWISSHRESGSDLTNLTDGGEGTSGYKWSSESRKKKSLSARGEGTHTSVLTEKDVLKIHSMLYRGMGNKEIADLYKVTKQTIKYIRDGATWKHLYPSRSPFPRAEPGRKNQYT